MRDSAQLAGGGLSIAGIDPATADEWDATWAACKSATFFHSRDWSMLWSGMNPHTLATAGQVVGFSDGTRAVLPLTLRKRSNGLMASYLASAGGMSGGWISRDSLGPEHAALLTDYLLRRMHANLSWRINPYDPNYAVILGVAEDQCTWLDWGEARYTKALQAIVHLRRPLAFADVTHVINLEAGYSELFHNQNGVVRNAKKAAREGITIAQAETEAQWRQYYDVYLESVQRWGSDPNQAYPWTLFEAMFALRSPAIKLWIALHAGTIVSGAVCMYANEHVVYWHGASLERYFPMRPVNLLMLEIIRDACERGHRWYDFNPSGYGAGVTAFKQKFHPSELPCPLIYVDRAVKRVGRSLLLGIRG